MRIDWDFIQEMTIFMTIVYVLAARLAYGLESGWWLVRRYRPETAHSFGLTKAILWPIFIWEMLNDSEYQGCKVDADLAYGPWLAKRINWFRSFRRRKVLREAGWDV